MLRIGDFSKLSSVSVKTLRYYDEIGLFKPAVVDSFTSYRYYSADQLPRLNRIVGLRNIGLSLEEIVQLLTENSSLDQIRDILRSKQSELQRQLRDEQRKLELAEELLKHMEREGTMPAYDITIKNIDAQIVASIREVLPAYGDIGRLYGEIFGFLGSQRMPPAGPPLAIYHDDGYKEQDVDTEAAVPIAKEVQSTKKVTVRKLPPGQMACVIYKGPYSDIGQAYTALMTWVDKNGYRITDHCREVYLQGPGQSDPAAYITEIQLPVEKV
jgi:effector-binding domain-containing protein